MNKVVCVLFVTGMFGGCSLVVNPDPGKDLALECEKVPSSRNCTCPGGTGSGTQKCLEQGVWGPCSPCPKVAGSGGKGASGVGGKGSGGKGGSGTSGSGGKGGGGGTGGSSEKSAIYGTCAKDEDCQSPGVCLAVSGTRDNKTVVGHVCTQSCQSSDDCPAPAADNGSPRKQCSTDGRQCILSCSTLRSCPSATTCITKTDTASTICAWL